MKDLKLVHGQKLKFDVYGDIIKGTFNQFDLDKKRICIITTHDIDLDLVGKEQWIHVSHLKK